MEIDDRQWEEISHVEMLVYVLASHSGVGLFKMVRLVFTACLYISSVARTFDLLLTVFAVMVHPLHTDSTFSLMFPSALDVFNLKATVSFWELFRRQLLLLKV